MIIVCAGIYKSASSFAHQIVEGLVAENGLDYALEKENQWANPGNFYGALNNKLFEALTEEIPDEKMLALKTHDGMPPRVKDMIADGKVKAIITLRDPRDCALASKALGEHEAKMENGRPILTRLKTLDDAAQLIQESYKRQINWIKDPDTLVLSFSKLTRDPQACAEEISAHLGIPHKPQVVERLTSDLKKNVREFFGGKGNRWETELKKEEQEYLTEALKHQISIFAKYSSKQKA